VQSTTGTTTTEFDRLIMRDVDPTVASAIQDFRVQIGSRPQSFNLPAIFSDADTSSLVEFSTSAGTFDIETFDQFAPNSVRNFLNYVSSGRYNSTIFHGATAGSSLQGGGFQYVYNPNGANHLDPITTDPAVAQEPGLATLAGTLTTLPTDNATIPSPSQFLFNLQDSTNHSPSQNTVLGQMRGTGLQTVTNLAAIPTQNRGGDFSQIPLRNYPQPPNGNFPGDTKPLNYAFLNSATVLRQVDQRNGDALTYTVTGNTNPGVVTPTISGGRLTLTYATAGTTTITLRATDAEGRFVETSFKVTVGVIAIP
jgi:cyclophilin family peptidyl-prolyl cis-trans isomerase